ncbi:Cof-type HAD-IIB family hydrolase [Pseudolactococcus insecticola]|uniref:Haloacid dehalogenase n=1 Tax=Pseudolactococcus insecticola TaxID=2709158 RepID=A0A6A0B7W5_9LACT|nr:Cof-type HAD-IIB family hydrolase [Lactococcus insecticola]GFH41382.1 haloacid dehalogenase [Lactococcus insecticola]
MATKAVFFDLDGTLFTGTRNVAATTRRAIVELHKNKILVGVATGRGPAFVLPLMETLELDFAVTYNGQYIFTPKKVLATRPIDKTTLREVVDYAGKNGRDISLGMADGVHGSSLVKFGETRTAQVIAGILPKKMSGLTKNSFKNVVRKVKPQSKNLSEDIRKPVYQVIMVATSAETAEIMTHFPELEATRSNDYSADLISRGNSKLKGIARLGKEFDFDLSEVMAFGDSDNDLAMLSGVGQGIAMGNATPNVKAVASYITDHNNADGIAKALAHFGLINFKHAASFISKDDQFNKVKEFHRLMDGKTQEMPRVYLPEEASHRAGFKVEEIVEFLFAAANADVAVFDDLTEKLHSAIDTAATKVKSKPVPEGENALTGEVDALLDLLYFTYGSFALMGVDPHEVFNLVHKANLGKIFPDGKPHFDPETHKILKPDNWAKDFAPEDKIETELERQIRVAMSKLGKLDKQKADDF